MHMADVPPGAQRGTPGGNPAAQGGVPAAPGRRSDSASRGTGAAPGRPSLAGSLPGFCAEPCPCPRGSAPTRRPLGAPPGGPGSPARAAPTVSAHGGKRPAGSRPGPWARGAQGRKRGRALGAPGASFPPRRGPRGPEARQKPEARQRNRKDVRGNGSTSDEPEVRQARRKHAEEPEARRCGRSSKVASRAVAAPPWAPGCSQGRAWPPGGPSHGARRKTGGERGRREPGSSSGRPRPPPDSKDVSPGAFPSN